MKARIFSGLRKVFLNQTTTEAATVEAAFCRQPIGNDENGARRTPGRRSAPLRRYRTWKHWFCAPPPPAHAQVLDFKNGAKHPGKTCVRGWADCLRAPQTGKVPPPKCQCGPGRETARQTSRRFIAGIRRGSGTVGQPADRTGNARKAFRAVPGDAAKESRE